jgi:uncharacterized protein
MDRAKANEEEYFAREEEERKLERESQAGRDATLARRVEQERAETAAQRRCPKCRILLVQRCLRGVDIDCCNSCNGVWLDEGELERLTQRGPGLLRRALQLLGVGQAEVAPRAAARPPSDGK